MARLASARYVGLAALLPLAVASPWQMQPDGVVSASAVVTGHDENGDPTLDLKMGERGGAQTAAWASYAASYTTIGWDVLNITTASQGDQGDAMYAAGYLEGHLSQKAIWSAYQNMYPQFFQWGQKPPKTFTAWINKHMDWVAAKVAAPPAAAAEKVYWQTVGSILSQLRGVAAGYAAAAPAAEFMSPADFLIMNLDGDLETLMGAIGGMGKSAGAEIFEKLGFAPGAGYHCSALVRVAPDGHDLFFGHDTWDTYASMVRMYKHYNFHLGPGGAPTAVSMSSTPGWLSSVSAAGVSSVIFNDALI